MLGSLPELTTAFAQDFSTKGRELTHRLRIGTTLASCPRIVQMFFFEPQVNCLSFAAADSILISSSRDGKVHVNNVKTAADLISPIRIGQLSTSSLSPDERFILTASEDSSAVILDRVTGKEISRFQHADKVLHAVFDPSGKRIAIAGKNNIGLVWDIESKTTLFSLVGHSNALRWIQFSPNGEYLVTASTDNSAQLWNGKSGAPIGSSLKHAGRWVTTAAFSPDSKTLVTGGQDSRARIWSLPSTEERPFVIEHADRIANVAISPDGRVLATASYDSTVRLWSLASGLPLKKNFLLRHSSSVRGVAFSSTGRLLATSCSDGTVRIWDLSERGFDHEEIAGTVSEDGSVAMETGDGEIRLRRIYGGNGVAPVIAKGEKIDSAILSSDGRFVVTEHATATHPAKTLKLWDAGTGIPFPFECQVSATNPLAKAAISPLGSHIAFATAQETTLFNVQTGEKIDLTAKMGHRTGSVFSFSPNGDFLAVGSGPTLLVFDVMHRRLAFSPVEALGPINHIAFNPSGNAVVTCANDLYLVPFAAEQWRVSDGSRLGAGLWHRDGVLYASYSPNEALLVTAGEDFRATIWDTRANIPAQAPLLHKESVCFAEFNRKGDWIGTASRNFSFRLWETESGEPIIPSIRNPTQIKRLAFGDDPTTIVTIGDNGSAIRWSLSKASHPIGDLLQFSRLLAGEIEENRQLGTNLVQGAWDHLQQKYPTDFEATEAQIVKWHEAEFKQAKLDEAWTAALFHLKILQTLRP
jgi:WD40 repeat protein